ncbi:MAG: magnesium transporter [Candidatus Methylacidiphilales bacterium]
MILKQLFKPEVLELIDEGLWDEVRSFMVEWEAPEIAELIMEVDKKHRVVLYRLLPRDLAGEVFAHLDPTLQNHLIEDMADDEARELLTQLTPDDRTALFEELPSDVTKRLLQMLPQVERAQALQLLGYPEGSIGRLMTTEYVKVKPEMTIRQALDHIRKYGEDSETMSVIFVTDEKGRLLDDIRLRRFILADPDKKVADIMESNCVALHSFSDQEEAVAAFKKHDMFCMPVTDKDGVLLGAVTVDDVLDVAEEEATEDIYKGAAINPLNLSYREVSVWSLIVRRLPWLVALVFVSLASSSVIAAYEETLAGMITLAFFIPLLMGSGGNTGCQAATLVVRALSTNDLRLSQCFHVMWKEITVGVILGLVMGLASGVLGFIRGGTATGIIVGITMFVIVIATNLMGFFIPFILTKFKMDPAVASSPLITSVADSVCLLIYFTVASFFIPHLA